MRPAAGVSDCTRLFAVLLIAAAALNAAGYVLNWFDAVAFYDEAAHFVTPLAISGLVACHSIAHSARARAMKRPAFVLAVGAFGLAIGIAWELFEYAIGIIGDRLDTMIDLTLDTTGALAAGAIVASRR